MNNKIKEVKNLMETEFKDFYKHYLIKDNKEFGFNLLFSLPDNFFVKEDENFIEFNFTEDYGIVDCIGDLEFVFYEDWIHDLFILSQSLNKISNKYNIEISLEGGTDFNCSLKINNYLFKIDFSNHILKFNEEQILIEELSPQWFEEHLQNKKVILAKNLTSTGYGTDFEGILTILEKLTDEEVEKLTYNFYRTAEKNGLEYLSIRPIKK